MTIKDKEIEKAVAALNSKEHIQRCETWFVEMKKADDRLRSFPNANGRQDRGKASEACMRWAINFAMLNLDHLSAGDFLNVQYELDCFLCFEMKAPYFMHLVNPQPYLPKEEIIRIQQWIKVCLGKIADKQFFHYLAPEESHHLHPPRRKEAWQHTTVGEDRGPHGVQPFFRIIVKHIDNLCRCPALDCHRIFLKDRTNQTFCSAQCQWRTATRKVRKTPLERFGKRGRPRKEEELKAKPSKKEKSTSRTVGRTKPTGGKHGAKKRKG